MVGRAGGAGSGGFVRAGGGGPDRWHTDEELGPRGLDRGLSLSLDAVDLTGWRSSRTSKGPLCFYHAALVWAVVRDWGDTVAFRLRLWGLIGLLAGCAMGCKYTALISAVIPFGVLALADSWRSRSLGPGGVFPLGLGGRHGALADQERDRHRQSRLSACEGNLRRPRLDNRPEKSNGTTLTGPSRSPPISSGNRSSMSPAGPTGSRRLYVALAPLALLRPGSQASGTGALGITWLPVRHLVALYPSAGPILAATLACRWRYWPDWGPTGAAAVPGRSSWA